MKHKDIRLLDVHVLRGPNLWTYRPVLEAWVDIGELEECPSNTIPGFVDRLCTWLPNLAEHRCSYGEPGGFVQRLREGTWPAHILEHVTLELQNQAGMPGGFGRARETGVRGVYKVAVRARQEDVSRACLEAARDLVMAAIEDRLFDVEGTQARLAELARQQIMGPDTTCIVDAARARDRGIPVIRLPADNLVQLGYGSGQRRIWATETDRTSAIAEGITRDPELLYRLLKSCGLPVPARMAVATAEEAREAAADLGLPVALKRHDSPAWAGGIVVVSDGEVGPAYQQLAAEDATVIVEAVAGGNWHRLLVVGGSLVAAARLDVGDSPGATADVTNDVHPATAAAACLAARVAGLDIAGVDLVVEDVTRPLAGQGGVITAVRAGPGLVMHLESASGEPRPVGRAIVDHLFPDGGSGRIPVVGVTGSVGTNKVARLVAEFLRLGGTFTGLACEDGLFFGRRLVEASDSRNWLQGRRVLMNRSVGAAVLENTAEVILGQGLAYDRCQVGVVTRIDPERHFGRYYIEQPEQVFQVLRTQIDVVLPDGVAVLNAADPMVVEMAPLCDGEVIFFGIDPALPVIIEHRARGGRAVFVRGEWMVLATEADETPLVPLLAIPSIDGDDPVQRLESVLAAVGAAWALGLAHHVICTGLKTFSRTFAFEDPTQPGSPDPGLPQTTVFIP